MIQVHDLKAVLELRERGLEQGMVEAGAAVKQKQRRPLAHDRPFGNQLRTLDEQVHAVYGLVSQGLGKFDMQAGLRAEEASRDFKLKTSDYGPMARRIASVRLPTLIVMEGGYAVEALGANVAEFLGGFE